MRCGVASAVLAGIVACIAYCVLRGERQLESKGSGAYKLGSGKMFDSIAPRYDLINKVMSLGLDMRWRRAMVEGLQLRAGDRVVDIATGTADVAIMVAEELAKLEGAAGSVPERAFPGVIGIDPSARMLEVGREKLAEAGLSSRVVLQIGDAQDLAEVADGSVDKLTMAFGIRNVPDRLKALREIRRIMATPAPPAAAAAAGQGLASGMGADSARAGAAEGVDGEADARASSTSSAASSIVAILELQDPETGLLASASRAFIKHGAPVLGWMMSGSGAEYGHLKNSILNFPSTSEWTALMAEAGLEVFIHETMGFGTVHLYLARPRVETGSSQ